MPAAFPTQFEARFDTAADFYDRFDYGVSGTNQLVDPGGRHMFHGDHNTSCEGPTTGREVRWLNQPLQTEMFWHCAPGNDPARGHVMSGIDTFGYIHGWFSPKQYFEKIQQVCFEVNANFMSARKWLELQFVDEADATRYPTGTQTPQGVAAGSGGFDLGYGSPNNRENGPNTGLFPRSGNHAGMEINQGNFAWFQNQDSWVGSGGWPGRTGLGGLPVVTDKAPRFPICVQNAPGNKLRIEETLPLEYRPFNNGEAIKVHEITGQIPQHKVRVAFHDANYDPPKDGRYSETSVTWHWDNIRIDAASATAATAIDGPSSPRDTPSTAGDFDGAASASPRGPDSGAQKTATDPASLIALIGLLVGVAGLGILGIQRSGRRARGPAG
jgi:hypothetical protein